MKRCLFLLLFIPFLGFGQFEEYIQEDPEPTVHKEGGFAFSVVESGTGLGGFYSVPLRGFMHVGANMNFFFLRDSKQVDYYDYYYGVPITLNKKNNVYLMDLMLTFKKRLLAHEIDDNLRPFLAVSAGPVFGMNFPENDDFKDQYRWAFGASAAAGVDVALDGGFLFGLRVQYRLMKFDAMLGERQDHSMFDLRLEIGKLLK